MSRYIRIIVFASCFSILLLSGLAQAQNRQLHEGISFMRSCLAIQDSTNQQKCLERQYSIAYRFAQRYYWEEWRRARYRVTGILAWTHCMWLAQAALRLALLDVTGRTKWMKKFSLFVAKSKQLKRLSIDVDVPPPPPYISKSPSSTLPPPPSKEDVRRYNQHNSPRRRRRSQRPKRHRKLTKSQITKKCVKLFRECSKDCPNRRCRRCCLRGYHRCKRKQTDWSDVFQACR